MLGLASPEADGAELVHLPGEAVFGFGPRAGWEDAGHHVEAELFHHVRRHELVRQAARLRPSSTLAASSPCSTMARKWWEGPKRPCSRCTILPRP